MGIAPLADDPTVTMIGGIVTRITLGIIGAVLPSAVTTIKLTQTAVPVTKSSVTTNMKTPLVYTRGVL